MIGAIELGRMCRVMMRVSDAPSARAASTYSFSLMPKTELRKTRAMLGQPRMPMAMKTFWTALAQHGDQGDGEQDVGEGEEHVGHSHDEAIARRPRRRRPTPPRTRPMRIEIAVATTPTTRDTRAP